MDRQQGKDQRHRACGQGQIDDRASLSPGHGHHSCGGSRCGSVSALLEGATDCGAFLDIVSDFVFYGAVVFGFALADPVANALAAAALLTAILINGSAFLAFAVFAEKRKIIPAKQPAKGLYYLGGVAEGAETIVFFLLCCLFPGLFAYFAWIFAGLCLLSGISRLVSGYFLLR